MLDPGAELGQHRTRYVRGHLGAEEHPDALRPDQLHGLLHRLQECLGRVGEKQMSLIEQEDQLRFVQVADLGQLFEQLREQPHQEGGEQHRVGLQTGRREQRDDPPAVRGDPQQVVDVQFRLSEEPVAALRVEVGHGPQDDPGGCLGDPAEFTQVLLPLVAGQVHDDRAQVLEVQQRQRSLVGPMEDQAEGRLLGVVERQHFRQQDRAERIDAGPDRNRLTLAGQADELDRIGGRRPTVTGLRRPLW